MKRCVRMAVRIKNCDKIFDEGFRPGEIAMQELIFDEDPETYRSTMFHVSLLNREEQFLKDNVEVVMEEVPVD